jgi:hypothetical protein
MIYILAMIRYEFQHGYVHTFCQFEQTQQTLCLPEPPTRTSSSKYASLPSMWRANLSETANLYYRLVAGLRLGNSKPVLPSSYWYAFVNQQTCTTG